MTSIILGEIGDDALVPAVTQSNYLEEMILNG